MSFIKLVFRPLFHFFTLYLTNYFFSYVPIRIIRKIWLRFFMHSKIGKKTYIDMGCYYMCPFKLSVGNYTHINRECFLDCRGSIEIGNRVSISHRVNLVTGSHDINSSANDYISKPIKIEDYVFIGFGATILQGVTIGKGAVICAGACVTKNVAPYAVVGGIPAKVIRNRRHELNYKCNPHTFFC